MESVAEIGRRGRADRDRALSDPGSPRDGFKVVGDGSVIDAVTAAPHAVADSMAQIGVTITDNHSPHRGSSPRPLKPEVADD